MTISLTLQRGIRPLQANINIKNKSPSLRVNAQKVIFQWSNHKGYPYPPRPQWLIFVGAFFPLIHSFAKKKCLLLSRSQGLTPYEPPVIGSTTETVSYFFVCLPLEVINLKKKKNYFERLIVYSTHQIKAHSYTYIANLLVDPPLFHRENTF